MSGSASDGHQTVANKPGQDAITYRVDDFAGFRRALLRSREGERELVGFTPTSDDLGLQILEWWAYLGDILAFYNERIANESYLRTATRPESLDRLVRVIGYRPRPGIAATGRLAALRRPGRPNDPLVIPAGTAITSTPTPGVSAQTFETLVDATFTGSAAVPVTLIDPHPTMTSGTVLLAGKAAGVKRGERLLLLPTGWKGETDDWALVRVGSTTYETDALGNANTRVTYASVDAGTDPGTLASDPTTYRAPTGYRLLRMTASATWWPHGDPSAGPLAGDLHVLDLQDGGELIARLAAAVRGISPGDILLVDDGDGAAFPAYVQEYSEELWYLVVTADGTTVTSTVPTPPPSPAARAAAAASAAPTPPVFPIPHSVLTLAVTLSVTSTPDASACLPRFVARDVGTVIATPPEGTAGMSWPLTVLPNGAVPTTITTAFLEDSTAAGVLVTVSPGAEGQLILDAPSGAAPTLTAPLRLLFDVVTVSRGTSVPAETLGSGDARVVGQRFSLAKSPLTYLAAGAGYASTLRVWVNGVAWTEVDTFYSQPADAPVFVTRELPDGSTIVRFGDGVNGARLPTGTGNVVASYRYGSGESAPPAGRLTTVARPQPNLAGFRNPVAVAGGADPDPPSSLRTSAPASTLTFGRAVSAADYETIAAQTSGVRRAKAVWGWNADEQRALVTVYVGDDDDAAGLAQAALAGSDDPERPVRVVAAIPVDLTLACTLLVRGDRRPGDVSAAALAALLDPQTGLFSPSSMSIGEPLYRSRLDAVLSVDGVVAVQGLDVRGPARLIAYPRPTFIFEEPVFVDLSPELRISAAQATERAGAGSFRHAIPVDIPPLILRASTALTDRLAPTEGAFFRLSPEHTNITAVVASDV